MRRIPLHDYRALLAAGSVIERDAHGEKLLALPSGEYVKIFRRKRWLSSALLFPYARRFARNAAILARRGIVTVEILDMACCPPAGRHLVTYRPLPGETLRARLRQHLPGRGPLLENVAVFVAGLHQRGIYFRSLHFGNVVVMPDGGGLGLIDIADMMFRSGPLDVDWRLRNFGHMLRYAEDAGFLQEFGVERFAGLYLEAAQLDGEGERRVSRYWNDLPVSAFPSSQ